jgi:uncharacterized protein YrzB (UPF0473 family)
MNFDQITITGKNGEQMVCQVLLTFRSDTTGKDYIVYTDNSRDEAGNTRVFASIYDPSGENNRLINIESPEEWRMIEELLQNLQDEILSSEAGEEILDPEGDILRGADAESLGILMS